MARSLKSRDGLLNVDSEMSIKEQASPTNPDSGYVKIYPKSDGKLYKRDSAGVETAVGSGGGLNTFFTADFEGGISDASTTDGTNLAISHETTNPLVGAGSLRITNNGSATTSDYVSIGSFSTTADFPVTLFTVKFFAKTGSGYSDEDLTVVAYDGTNEIVIQPEGLLAGSGFFIGTFQSTPGAGTYEIRLKVANVASYTVDIDNLEVSKTEITHGAVVTAGKIFNSSLNNFGNATQNLEWYRIGQRMYLSGSIIIGSILPDGLLEFSLPPGYNLLSGARVSGTIAARDGSAIQYIGSPRSISTTAFRISGPQGESYWSDTVPFTFSENDQLFIHVSAPIAGWGAQAQLGSDVGFRDVVFSGRLGLEATDLPPVDTPIEMGSILADSGVYSGGVVTIPESGYYVCSMADSVANMRYSHYIYADLIANKDGSDTRLASGRQRVNNSVTDGSMYRGTPIGASVPIYLYKNDTVRCELFAKGVDPSETGAYRIEFSVYKLNNSKQIFAGEKVRVEASTNAGQSVTPAGNDFVAEDVVEDTHNAYDETTGEFTSPKSGVLRVSVVNRLAGTSLSTSNIFSVSLSKDDGSGYSLASRLFVTYGNGGTIAPCSSPSTSIKVSKGDKVKVELACSVSSNLTNNNEDNRLVFEID